MSGTIDHVNVKLGLDSKLLNPLDLSSPDDSLIYSIIANLSNGTGASQASQQWHDTRTIAPSGTDSIDLAGALVNAFGVTVTFTKVKLLLVRAAAANLNNIQVARPASNGWPWFLAVSDGFLLQPGAFNVFFDPGGIAVTAGTGDLLSIINAAGVNSVTYDIVVVGTD
jgi:hypothetical protein